MVVAPARAVPPSVADRVTDLASHHVPELELQFHPQCFAAHGHFAGDDTTRQNALIEAANDPDLDAIWFGRGGYGSVRLLSNLVASLGPAARQKTYLGYSDTGALLATLYGAGIGNCIHGPMPSDVQRIGG
ncbi:MAG: LD-carboxypeptidase, partial [Pseudomonadota bacterium]